MKNIAVLDVETTGATNGTKGSCFTPQNRLCLVGIRTGVLDASQGISTGDEYIYDIEYGDSPYGTKLAEIQKILDNTDLLIGFNIKFDLLWLRRYGLFYGKDIWDCQAVDYLVTNMQEAFPSLDQTSKKWAGIAKIDRIKTEYWDKGIDTDKVPLKELREYLVNDLYITYRTFRSQLHYIEYTRASLINLIRAEGRDILTLCEMEWNGIKYDFQANSKKAKETNDQIRDIEKELIRYSGNVPINFSSGRHVSALLYGGIIREDIRETYLFTYKDGRTAEKTRSAVREHVLPSLVKPLKGTELATKGYYKTDEFTLRRLKTNKISKRVIDLLLERAKLEKLLGSYLLKYEQLALERGWSDFILHGQFCNVVTRTGRLASKDPNLQNSPEILRTFIISRFT